MTARGKGAGADSVLIDNSTPSWAAYFSELYRFREVARMMIRRERIVRFRHTYFGVAWLLFRPAMLMLVVSLAFGAFSRMESPAGIPYPLIVLCGVIPWSFFANAVSEGTHSIVAHLQVIQKTYFPRVIVPLTAVTINAYELAIAWLLFAIGCVWYGFMPTWKVVFLPVFLVLTICLATGLALWLSMLYAQFRDVGHLVTFFLSIAFFVSPVGYALAAVPEKWQALFILNPLVGIVEGIRWSLLADAFPLSLAAVASSAVGTLVVLASGLWYFRSNESAIVDFV
jgi:lipopolysaccharide transport system permease protein